MPNKRLHLATAFVAVIGLLMLVASGCTSVSRGVGKVTANKYATPSSGTVWAVPPPQLDPPSPENKTVYISFRNISDAQSVELGDKLRNAAQEQGWTVVRDPQKAHYRLRASLRYFGEVKPDSGGKQVANNMGLITGAAVGVGTGAAVAEATGSGAAGVASGVGAGGLAGQGIANASRPREWAMIIDFVLEEYRSEKVEFKVTRESGSQASTGSGTGSSRMSASGETSEGSTRSGTITKTSHYFPHGVRLSAWANQMNMRKKEALPLIRESVQKVIDEMLPQ